MNEINTEFSELTQELLANPLVQRMSEMKQHSDAANLLEHSLYTAYVAYKLCGIFNLNTEETVRGALLHDFRLEEDPSALSLFTHSGLAVKQAAENFDLSELEKDIIRSHMWPVTPLKFPKSKEALIVNLADTYCATIEFLHLFKKTKTTKKIVALSSTGV